MSSIKEIRVALVLVTGASRGIGLSTSLVLARAGHQVLATMRSPARAPELARAAQAESLPIFISAMDVDSDESVRTGMSAITAAHGVPDVLVNNAGIEQRGSVE
jgi:NAD(P)-dependent dehydrogenase (short-subunit alcohol dehydrogenase family)